MLIVVIEILVRRRFIFIDQERLAITITMKMRFKRLSRAIVMKDRNRCMSINSTAPPPQFTEQAMITMSPLVR